MTILKHLLWIVACLGGLISCKEPVQDNQTRFVQDNQTLMKGKEYKLWFLEAYDMWRPKFIYFDRSGIFQTLEFDAKGSHTFSLYTDHPLNGRWESRSDSVITLNGQPFRMVVHPEDNCHDLWITLHNPTTGDSIRLMDARFPPKVSQYDPGYNYMQWKNEIQSSVLLKGKKYKLYRWIREDWVGSFDTYTYFDDYGLASSIHLFYSTHEKNWAFEGPDRLYLPPKFNWHQQGNTIIAGEWKYLIRHISASGDSITLFEIEDQVEHLYIDTKLPPPRK